MKLLITALDKKLNHGRILRSRQRVYDSRFFSVIEGGMDRKIVISYMKNNFDTLAALCDKYGSDKGSNKESDHCYPWPAHSYTDIYGMLFESRRNDVKAIFECGLGTTKLDISANMGVRGSPGASLRVWRDYFCNAKIYGADIDTSTLFKDDRIETSWMDQTDPVAIQDAFTSFGDVSFDLIIDDGLHTYHAGRTLFEAAFNKLTPGGLYVIEDVYKTDLLRFKKYFEDKLWDVSYVFTSRAGDNFGDHSLIIIKNNARRNNKEDS